MDSLKALLLGCSLLAALLLAPAAGAAELPVARPVEVGLAAEELAKIDSTVDRLIEETKLAGATVMVARRGKLAYFKAFGQMDIEGGRPMRPDTIFRIYSMTKSITTAGALMLCDEGKIHLDDPVSKYIPALAKVKVWTEDGLVEPHRGPTVRDLMRHTSGFTYGSFGNTPVDKLYREAQLLSRDQDLQRMCDKLAELPLLFHPGEDWNYSVSTDVLGRVIEVASATELDRFFRERIFEPLGMVDTGFFVPAEKASRLATTYRLTAQGNLEVFESGAKSAYLEKPAFLSGGGGLVSTSADYMRFLQMIAQGGSLDGVRLLKAETVRLMTTNQLPNHAMPVTFGTEERQGVGFGLGFSVFIGQSKWDDRGRLGEYGWGGLASTHYWVSPKDDLVVVTMEQTLPYSFLLEWALKGTIYDALE